MTVAGVRRDDQRRALWLSTTAFTVCFSRSSACRSRWNWDSNETQFGLLIGTPILTGSLIRLMLGIWTDQYGGRIVYTAVMLSAGGGYLAADVCLRLPDLPASRTRCRKRRRLVCRRRCVRVQVVPQGDAGGTALGFFGAGNVGAAVTKFAAPFVMVAYGWKTVAIAAMAIIFWLTTRDDPQLEARRRSGAKPESLRIMQGSGWGSLSRSVDARHKQRQPPSQTPARDNL